MNTTAEVCPACARQARGWTLCPTCGLTVCERCFRRYRCCRAERAKAAEFRRAWTTLEAAGACDGWGGAECSRVWREYLEAGLPADVADFIHRRANILSDGTEGRT